MTIILGSKLHNFLRFAASTTVDYVATFAAATPFTARGSLQPSGPETLDLVPEGYTSDQTWMLYTQASVELVHGDMKNDDIIPDRLVRPDGTVLHVFGKADWGDGLLTHNVYILVEGETEHGGISP